MARSVLRAEQLGVRLNSLGMAPGVGVEPTDREYRVQLHAASGTAILPLSKATIASHWMTMPTKRSSRCLKLILADTARTAGLARQGTTAGYGHSSESIRTTPKSMSLVTVNAAPGAGVELHTCQLRSLICARS